MHLTNLIIRPTPAAILLLFAAAMAAQPPAFNNEALYQVRASRTTQPISVNGRLEEAVWQQAELVSDFWLQSPVDGQRASRRTEVRLAYDGLTLYVAATCFDTSGTYYIETLKRDAYGDSDEFGIVLDPQGQKANGFGFGVNAFGAQTEVLLTPTDGDGSWDNRWASAVQRHSDRWVVEMAIPFKTLRFEDGSNNWHVNFLRTEPDFNQTHTWAPVPRQFEQHDFGYMGSIIWADGPPTRQGGNVALIPYALTAVQQEFLPKEDSDLDARIGGDAKIALTSSLNLDLTTFPDFSQVDVDEQVINLTRFNIFFPERRQFFIENGDIFQGFGTDFGVEQPFFSRSIGLDAYGKRVPILYGARLTGNLTPRLRAGAFNIHTRTQGTQPGNNYSALAFQQRLWQRSSLKGVFLNRQGFDGSESIGSDYGRNLGGEFEYVTPDGKWAAKTGYLHSFKAGVSSENSHRYARVAYNGTRFRTTLEGQQMGRDYYSDMGFTGRLLQYNPDSNRYERVGFTQLSNMLDLYTFPKDEASVLNFHWTGLENFVWFNTDGSLNEWYMRLRHFFFFKNTARLRFRLNHNYVDLLYPLAITEVPLPAKSYHMTEFNTQFNTDQRRRLALEVFAVYGQFFGGTKLTSRTELTWRAQPWGNFGVGLDYNYIWLPQPYGDTDLVLGTARVEVNFATNLFWTTFLQYNTQADNFNLNSRLQWRFAPMSDLFLVFNDNHAVEGKFGPKDRTVVLKLNYWLSL